MFKYSPLLLLVSALLLPLPTALAQETSTKPTPTRQEFTYPLPEEYKESTTQAPAPQLTPSQPSHPPLSPTPEKTLSTFDLADRLPTPADGGDYLTRLPGISASRLGAHGADPVIRGQQQKGRVRVQLDGASLKSGCPNRMDPVTSYAPPEWYDAITVTRGVQSLAPGHGGTGGTVHFERTNPTFREGKPWQGRATSGYANNGQARHGTLDFAAGTSLGYGRIQGLIDEAENDTDGDGHAVRSAYSQHGGSAILGLTPTPHTTLRINAEYLRADNVLFAGAGMDSVFSQNRSLRFDLHHTPPNPPNPPNPPTPPHSTDASLPLSDIRLRYAYSEVEHLMDNYSLRPNTATRLRAPSDTFTHNGSLSTSWALTESWTLSPAADFRLERATAVRQRGTAPGLGPTLAHSYLWPDARIDQFGLSLENTLDLCESTTLTASLRYDHVEASIGDGALTPPGAAFLSPNALYLLYTGVSDTSACENNLSGLLRAAHTFADKRATAALSLSSTSRTADATERYIASNSPAAASRWVGNPSLDPEQHYQVQASFDWNDEQWDASLAVFGDWVDDYIIRDRARLQNGILRNDRASVYRNVNASLWGVEASATRRWAPCLSTSASLSWIEGANLTDHRPLAQIPPLEGLLNAELHPAGQWALGTTLRLVATQTRADTSIASGSGLDPDDTSGFVTWDLYTGVRFLERFHLRGGVSNLLDHTYAEHLNRANLFNGDTVQFNSPGRTFWTALSAEF